MAGSIVGDAVVVGEQSEASKIYNKGYFGTMQGGKLRLHLIEAAFLVEVERLVVEHRGEPVSLHDLMNYGLTVDANFEITYLVFRDLRQRGYVAKIDPEGLNLYPRGGAPHSHQPIYLVQALSERAPFSMAAVLQHIRDMQSRKLMLGVADEEGDLTYYYAKFFRMRGSQEEPHAYHGEITLLGDRSMVWDTGLARRLQDHYVGRDFGGGVMQLSLMETAYLLEKGARVLRNGQLLTLEEFLAYAQTIQPDIARRLRAYQDLRGRGLVPKTGFKFGSHFRVYREELGEGHAPYLVHVVPDHYTSTWTEISRAVRLANSVRKQMIFAVTGEEVEYVRLKRMTP
ncbi:MAG: tRNA-intron lyase [Candidatus Thermoplasmatota archaeon]|nr:tRNA-intron lyase [Candidatus Thermoplasmatota archaeon]